MPMVLLMIHCHDEVLFILLQIESIDDPVPAVEAILKRCNKQQVKELNESYR